MNRLIISDRWFWCSWFLFNNCIGESTSFIKAYWIEENIPILTICLGINERTILILEKESKLICFQCTIARTVDRQYFFSLELSCRWFHCWRNRRWRCISVGKSRSILLTVVLHIRIQLSSFILCDSHCYSMNRFIISNRWFRCSWFLFNDCVGESTSFIKGYWIEENIPILTICLGINERTILILEKESKLICFQCTIARTVDRQYFFSLELSCRWFHCWRNRSWRCFRICKRISFFSIPTWVSHSSDEFVVCFLHIDSSRDALCAIVDRSIRTFIFGNGISMCSFFTIRKVLKGYSTICLVLGSFKGIVSFFQDKFKLIVCQR